MLTIYASTSAFLKKWIQISWKFFAGALVVLTGFMTNFIDLKQPRVAVEITGIEQITSAAIDVNAVQEFVNFRKLISESLDFVEGVRTKYTAEDMQQVLDRSKQKQSDQKSDVAKLRNKMQAMPSESIAPKSIKPERWFPAVPGILVDFEGWSKLGLQKHIENTERTLKEKEELLSSAEAEVKTYKTRTERSDAKIVVTAAISNSGDGATTLKPQALLRTDLGQGNYLDINLKIKNYGSGVSEVKPRGTSVLTFESQAISRMSPEDQERFLNFFKNTSPTNLFISDVRGDFYKSNTIPFAQGIYEQKIYDGLKTYATQRRSP
jgi:hypothetical protein